MQTLSVKIIGIVPLLQNRYEMTPAEDDNKALRKVGVPNRKDDWKKALYINDEIGIYQPAAHIEGAMIKAAVNFQIVGKGKKTYRDLFKSSVFVSPEFIPHGKPEPDFIDRRLVRVNNSAVDRQRPGFKNWALEFEIQVMEDQINKEVVRQVLEHAGRQVGIGDFRPRYGRFAIERFE